MDTITIERAEYERLIEAQAELRALRAYGRTMAAIEAGEEELIPADYAKRLIAGESAVRVFRELRSLSQTRLADVSGVNRVQINNIENAGATGSVETLRKLADALGVTLDDLA